MQNNEEHKNDDGPIHLTFLHVLAFYEIAKGEALDNVLVAFWRNLVEFGSHCNDGASADTFGCWQVGPTTF